MTEKVDDPFPGVEPSGARDVLLCANVLAENFPDLALRLSNLAHRLMLWGVPRDPDAPPPVGILHAGP